MNFADKLNQKADELKEKAKAALREALEDTDRHTHTTHTSDAQNTDTGLSRDTPTAHAQPDHDTPSSESPASTRTPGSSGATTPGRPNAGDATEDSHRHDPTPARTTTTPTSQPATAHDQQQPQTRHHQEQPDHATLTTSASDEPSVDVAADQRLFSTQRAHDYTQRWNTIQGHFVDDPRQAITEADQLVGDILTELHALFTDQRRHLDHDLRHDQSSTEDLRVALSRYRDFFNRLLSL